MSSPSNSQGCGPCSLNSNDGCTATACNGKMPFVCQHGSLHSSSWRLRCLLAAWCSTCDVTAEVTPLSLSPTDPRTTSSHDSRDIRCSVIDDVERGGYTFTDGCGIISHKLALRVCQARGAVLVHDHNYKPSVFQVQGQDLDDKHQMLKGVGTCLLLDHSNIIQ